MKLIPVPEKFSSVTKDMIGFMLFRFSVNPDELIKTIKQNRHIILQSYNEKHLQEFCRVTIRNR